MTIGEGILPLTDAVYDYLAKPSSGKTKKALILKELYMKAGVEQCLEFLNTQPDELDIYKALYYFKGLLTLAKKRSRTDKSRYVFECMKDGVYLLEQYLFVIDDDVYI